MLPNEQGWSATQPNESPLSPPGVCLQIKEARGRFNLHNAMYYRVGLSLDTEAVLVEVSGTAATCWAWHMGTCLLSLWAWNRWEPSAPHTHAVVAA